MDKERAKVPSLAEWASSVEDRFEATRAGLLKTHAAITKLLELICSLHDIDFEAMEEEFRNLESKTKGVD